MPSSDSYRSIPYLYVTQVQKYLIGKDFAGTKQNPNFSILFIL